MEKSTKVVRMNKSPRTLYEIVLKHKSDAKKDITLFSSFTDDKLDDSFKNFQSAVFFNKEIKDTKFEFAPNKDYDKIKKVLTIICIYYFIIVVITLAYLFVIKPNI